MNIIKIIAARQMAPPSSNWNSFEGIAVFNPRSIVMCKQRPASEYETIWVGLIGEGDESEPAVYASHSREMLHRQAYEHYRDLWANVYKDMFPDEVIDSSWHTALWQLEDIMLDYVTYDYFKVPIRG